ncbi:MAG: ATP-grasp domain-containing protein [Halobacteriovoraceae bacterium]|nr:ATP-grasp domain-containing protein [Halobacteriovoraceae bacterium]
MNILLSGGRAPFTLELLRLLSKQGHQVSLLEFSPFTLSSYSQYAIQTYLLPPPARQETQFISELIALLKNQSFDLFIPTCEEVIYLSKYKRQIEDFTSLFTCDFSKILKLHNKETFNLFLKEKNLPTPQTFRDLSEVPDSMELIKKKRWSRFGIHVEKITKTTASKEIEDNSYIFQEFISGKEYCLYCVVLEGKIQAYSCYEKQFSIDGGASNYFEHFESPEILFWMNQFFEGEKITGQFSFDLIVSSKDQLVYAIECNPRATSGIHLLKNDLKAEHFLVSQLEVTKPSVHKPQMLGLSLLLFCFQWKNKFGWVKALFRAEDVVFRIKDPLPFFGQFVSVLYFALISIRTKRHIVDATTYDIEFNGP